MIDSARADCQRRRVTPARASGHGAAVDDDDLAVHEAVAVADHEGGELGEFTRTAHAPGRGPELVHLYEPFGKLMPEFRVEDARGDGVDGDAEGRGLARKAFGEANHRGLRRGVVYGRGESAYRADRGDVENRALALPNHLLVDGLRDGEEAVDVRVDYLVPRAVGRGGEVVAAVDCGVVDEDVYAAPLLHHLARHVLEADAIRDGNFEGVRAAAVCLYFALRLLRELVARVVVEGHVSAFAREDFAEGRAYSARPAGDEGALPFQKKTQLDSLQSDERARSFCEGEARASKFSVWAERFD